MLKGLLLLCFLAGAVRSNPLEEHLVKREAAPNPGVAPPQAPQQGRPQREIFGQGYGFDRGYYGGGEHLGGFDRDFFGGREEYGRFGGYEEFGRPEVVIEKERFGGPYGRYGGGYEQFGRPEVILEKERIERPYGRFGGGFEEYGRPEVILEKERIERPFGQRCNCYGERGFGGYDRGFEGFPRFEGLYGGRGFNEGAYPGLCIPYNNYHNY